MQEIKKQLEETKEALKNLSDENYIENDIFNQLRACAMEIARISIKTFDEEALNKALKIVESITNLVNYLDDCLIWKKK